METHCSKNAGGIFLQIAQYGYEWQVKRSVEVGTIRKGQVWRNVSTPERSLTITRTPGKKSKKVFCCIQGGGLKRPPSICVQVLRQDYVLIGGDDLELPTQRHNEAPVKVSPQLSLKYYRQLKAVEAVLARMSPRRTRKKKKKIIKKK